MADYINHHPNNVVGVSAPMHVMHGGGAAVYPSYHPTTTDSMMTGGGHEGGVLVTDVTGQEAYIAPAIAHAGMETAPEQNAFMPLPQAPRLPVAAARASNMAAMYYDPTLHPQHVYNGNVNPSAPWSLGYFGAGGEYVPTMAANTVGTAAMPFQHRHVEHQPHQQPLSHAFAGNGHSAPYGHAFAAAPTFPSGARASSVSGPTAPHAGQYNAQNSFAMYPHDGAVIDAAQNVHQSNVHAFQTTTGWDGNRWTGAEELGQNHPAPVHRNSFAGVYEHQQPSSISLHQGLGNPSFVHAHHGQGMNGVGGGMRPAGRASDGQWHFPHHVEANHQWDAHQVQPQHPHHLHNHQHPAHFHPHAAHQRAALHRPVWPWSNAAGGEGAWPVQRQTHSEMQGVTAKIDSQSGHWQTTERSSFPRPPLALPGPTAFQPFQPRPIHGAMEPTQQNVAANMHKATMYADDRVSTVKQAVDEANAPKNTSGPAPPSPDTLDKSAVPISLVGAEIIWIAAAALLDPSLWLQSKEFTQMFPFSVLSSRKRMASPTSSSDASPYTTPFTSPLHTSNDGWHKPSSSLDTSGLGGYANLLRSGNAPRHAVTDVFDESSASSSEPGTPPTSLPLPSWSKNDGGQHHAKRVSMSALRGMRSLGLNSEDTARSAVEMNDRRSASPMDMHSPRSRSFRRSDSYDRSRENVASVTGLLRREWRWSVNEDKLDSLRHSQRRDAHSRAQNEQDNVPTAPPMTRRTSSQSRSVGREDAGLAMFGGEASPAFRRFTHQVLAQTLVSPTAFMLGLMYALRVLHLAVTLDPATDQPCLDPEAAEIFAQPPSAAPFKLFTLGLMIANKHLDDNTFLNKTWNEVTGISLTELNRAERWFLERCSYEITVPEESWVGFLERLHARTEQRIHTLSSAKRIRVPIVKEAPDAPRKRSDSYVVPHAGSEEAQKRLLLSAEDALQALGRAPTFALNSSGGEHGAVQQSASHEDVELQHVSRPRTHLTHMHQHCRSAPVVSVDRLRQSQEADVDVFEDENGPCRPYAIMNKRESIRQRAEGTVTIPLRDGPASETTLSRSVSDSFAPTLSSSCAHEESRTRIKRDSIGQASAAPLAPSVLLELLNKGQQLAHTAH